MSIQLPNSLCFARVGSHTRKSWISCIFVPEAGDLKTRLHKIASTEPQCFEEQRERIAKLLRKSEVSVSAYDTAWVAMIPSPYSPKEPCFRECLHWLVENQCPDGSWTRPHQHQFLQKDVLSSTLACVIALKKWGVGEEQINKGTHFVELNFAVASDEHQICPMGFDIIFPEMLEYARDLFLNLDLDPTTLNAMIYKRDVELKSYQSRLPEMEAYMAYVAEGMGKFLGWESVMKYQRKNGSLFNCPSTTAAAYICLPNANSLSYLQSAVKKFGNAVPTSYPLNIHCQLYTVDNVESLGISRYFCNEIQDVLDETYRSWLQGDEEIFMDASTCALAFRLLLMHGYSVSSDQIMRAIEDFASGSSYGNKKDMHTALELYNTSQLIIHPNELELEKQKSRLKHMLEQELFTGSIHSDQLSSNIDQKVGFAFRYPFYAVIDRIGKRRNMEHYNLNNTRILKTSYFSANFAHKDFLSLSLEDFNRCQTMHRNELKELERWVVDNELDVLKFARQKCAYCYFSAAATSFPPELYEARMSWAKNAVLTTVVDDFFDVGGSMEELEELIQLLEAWDTGVNRQYSSQNVKIIYSALRCTICEIGDKGHILQGRDVTNHIREIWLDLLHSMMKEVEWARDDYHPTMDEYMDNAYVSFALGPIVLPALYLVGPKLSEKMVSHPEYHILFRLLSSSGRLLNDIRSCEREMKDGKLNAIPLYLINNGGEMTKESAIQKINSLIESNRKELLRLVLEGKNSVVPRPCKDLFWHMMTVLNFTYSKNDGFTSEDFNVVKQILHEPIVRNDI